MSGRCGEIENIFLSFLFPCDFSENATDTILPMVLKNSQGNINIESDANLCSSSNNLPIANNSPVCAADFPTLASSGINNANASASVSTYVGNDSESDMTFSGAFRDFNFETSNSFEVKINRQRAKKAVKHDIPDSSISKENDKAVVTQSGRVSRRCKDSILLRKSMFNSRRFAKRNQTSRENSRET